MRKLRRVLNMTSILAVVLVLVAQYLMWQRGQFNPALFLFLVFPIGSMIARRSRTR